MASAKGLQALSWPGWPPLGAFIKPPALRVVHDSALRKWVKRFAREGTHGLLDRPRSGRPAKMTSQIETPLHQFVDQDPLHHGSIHSQWSCRELASVLSQQSGVSIGRESVRLALKKMP